MRAIIVEDEKMNIEKLEMLLAEYCPGVKIVGVAMTVDEAVVLISQTKPDMVFLDIELGSRTGFDLLSALGRYNFEVIFITAFDSYAIQAVKRQALDYILKPVKPAELVLAVEKALNKAAEKSTADHLKVLFQKQPDDLIVLPFLKEYRYVRPGEIVRCESSKSYTTFHLASGEKLTATRLISDYEEMLMSYHFIRCHQSHLVNHKFIRSLTKDDTISELVLKDDTKVPVARTRRAQVKNFIEQRKIGNG